MLVSHHPRVAWMNHLWTEEGTGSTYAEATWGYHLPNKNQTMGRTLPSWCCPQTEHARQVPQITGGRLHRSSHTAGRGSRPSHSGNQNAVDGQAGLSLGMQALIPFLLGIELVLIRPVGLNIGVGGLLTPSNITCTILFLVGMFLHEGWPHSIIKDVHPMLISGGHTKPPVRNTGSNQSKASVKLTCRH